MDFFRLKNRPFCRQKRGDFLSKKSRLWSHFVALLATNRPIWSPCLCNNWSLYVPRELMPNIARCHSIGQVSSPTFRQTELQYWLEIGRLISRDLSLRYHHTVSVIHNSLFVFLRWKEAKRIVSFFKIQFIFLYYVQKSLSLFLNCYSFSISFLNLFLCHFPLFLGFLCFVNFITEDRMPRSTYL